MKAPTFDIERVYAQVDAEVISRQKIGVWSGAVQAHEEYQGRPVAWMVEKLGIPEPTIRWSLNPEYQSCACPRCVKLGNVGRPHIWDGDVDPLVKAIELVFAGQSVAVSSGTTTGKAQPVDEPVLTPTGWRPIGALRVGDEVVGADGRPTEVIGVYPQGILPVYEVSFSDGARTRASGDHLWAIRSKGDECAGRPWKIRTTAELPGLSKTNSWRIPLAAPMQLPERDLPIDPYLLGVLLGDGCLTGPNPRISTADSEILATVRSLLPAVRMALGHRRHYDYEITRGRCHPIKDALRALGLWGKRSYEKHVPDEYLWASPAQRLALLHGLMDTDGGISKQGLVDFASTSQALADAVIFLVRSLGGKASKGKYASMLHGRRCRDHFRVFLRLPEGMVPFRLARKLARMKPVAPVRTIRSVLPAGNAECVCLRVAAPDQLYVTRDFIVTHNTYVLGAAGTLCFLAVFPKSTIFSIAPKYDLLLKNMWKEIGKLWPAFKQHFPQAQLLSGNLRMLPGEGEQEIWAATAFGAGVGAEEELAQRLKGFHEARMLWIVEEMPGVDQAMVETIIKTASSDFNPIMGLGNPEHQHDPLALFGKRSWVTPIRISAHDFPNVVCGRPVIPGGRSRESIPRDLADADGNEDDPRFLSQVRGIAPAQSKRALIKWDWCEAAATRYEDPVLRQGPQALGVDVADSPTGDDSCFSHWQGACCTEVTAFHAQDASEVADMVFGRINDADNPVQPRYVGIDPVGVGASTINTLKRLKVRVPNLAGSLKPVPRLDTEALWSETRTNEDGRERPAGPKVIEAERYANLRSQVFWRLREDLRLARIALPKDQRLFEELTAIEYEEPGYKITVMPKDDVRKRLGRSPDRADAVAYGNWVRPRVPVRAGEQKIAPVVRNRDVGLEKILARHRKRQEAEDRRLKRAMARQKREHQRGGRKR